MKEVDVCLCVIFNHKYEANLSKLRAMYSSRFSTVLFLMPFYRGTESDVLTYHANSHSFQLSVTQNLEALKAVNANYYVFIADDLILNPSIDERNVIVRLSGSVDRISLPAVTNLSDQAGQSWIRRLDVARLGANAAGVEWQPLLPKYGDMVKKIEDAGATYRVDITHFCDELTRLGHRLPDQRPLIVEPPYPCLAAYSDIFVIPKLLLDDFAHYAGVTAAMKLFVEVAIPTVSVMVSQGLNSIPVAYCRSTADSGSLVGKGVTYWGDGVDQFSTDCDFKLSNAFLGPRAESLFIHPIKLSRWS